MQGTFKHRRCILFCHVRKFLVLTIALLAPAVVLLAPGAWPSP
jgi:hypothetical protein